MDTRRVDLINIALMIISCVAAFMLPFEVFLLSYTILGPLHYLTEISWLHKRDYFASDKSDFLIFVPLGITFTYLALFDRFGEAQRWIPSLVFTSFVAALGMVFFRKGWQKVLLACLAFLIGYSLSAIGHFQVAFGLYMPTLIHVFIFTGLFLVYGALRSKQITGVLSALVFILCAISFFVYTPDINSGHVSGFMAENIKNLQMDRVIYLTIHYFHMDTQSYKELLDQVFRSVPGHSLIRFIAFAYAYHYLNWFSKTSIIQWHRMPRRIFIAVLVLWAASVILYLISFRLGLEVLLLLSILHVFMEFPLNLRSMVGIAGQLGIKIPTRSISLAVSPAAAEGNTQSGQEQ